jgi:hypothetical protein
VDVPIILSRVSGLNHFAMNSTGSDHQLLCKSWKKCNLDRANDYTSIREESMNRIRKVKTRRDGKGETGDKQGQKHIHYLL